MEGRPCGIALVTAGVGRRRGPFRLRTVHLGTAGEAPGESVFVEYNRLLVEPERRAAFSAAMIDELRREPGWHELHLDGFAPKDAAPLLASEPMLEAQPAACPVVELRHAQGADGSVLALLRSGTRRKIRRGLEALGEVETEWPRTPEQGLEILDELVELHQRRWTDAGEPGAFARPRFVTFHRELVRRLLPRGRVALFRVRAAGRTVGCLYHLIEGRRVLFYQSGLAGSWDKPVSPGFVCFALCMQACFERGFEEYDFLAGDSRYKRDLSTDARELIWAKGRRPAMRWALLDRLAAARRRVRPGSDQGADI